MQAVTPLQVALRYRYWGTDPLSFGTTREEHSERQASVLRIFDGVRDLPEVRFIDLAEPMLGTDGFACVESADGPLYVDDDHLSALGAERFLRGTLEQVFARPTQAEP